MTKRLKNPYRCLLLFILLFLTALFIGESALARKSSESNEVYIPDTVSVFGEEIPLKKQLFYEMLERELIISVCDRAQVLMWFKRSGRYFPHIEKMLKLKECRMILNILQLQKVPC